MTFQDLENVSQAHRQLVLASGLKVCCGVSSAPGISGARLAGALELISRRPLRKNAHGQKQANY